MMKSAIKSFLISLFISPLIFSVSLQATPVWAEEIAQMNATVVKISGDVRILSRGKIAWHDAKAGEILSAGDKIETKENGKIEIRLDNNNVINLKPNSDLILQKLTSDAATGNYENIFESSKGKFRAKVEKIKNTSKFEIKTPNAVACVRGTIMYLVVYPDSTMAFFEEGVGFVTNPFSGQAFDVDPGNVYQIDENGNVSGPVIPTSEQLQDIVEGWDVGAGAEGYSEAGGDDLGGDTGPNDNSGDAMNDRRNSRDSDFGSNGNNAGGGTTTSGGAGTTTETDTDGDGLTNERELNTWQTDPLVPNADADVDLIPDIEDAFAREDHPEDVDLDETNPDIYGSRDNIRDEIKDIIDRNALRDDIQDMIDDGNTRNLDARMEQVTDAQTGKVLTDRQGYRVRIEQYVLRPDLYTVQLLNISLRTQEAGSLAGLNTLDWTTRFHQSLDALTGGELRDLPWNEYLLGSPVKYGTTQPGYYPDWTQVRLENPQGNTFMEKKDFDNLQYSSSKKWHQNILWDKVSFDRGSNWYNFSTGNINGGNNPDGFSINPSGLGSSYDVDVRFYVISDSGTLVNAGNKAFDSIWEFLAVNMPRASSEPAPHDNKRNIGGNNLEIRLSSKFGGSQVRDIDLIYIPWNRQPWHASHNWED